MASLRDSTPLPDIIGSGLLAPYAGDDPSEIPTTEFPTTESTTTATTMSTYTPFLNCRHIAYRRECLMYPECTWDGFYGVCRHKSGYHQTSEWLVSTFMFLFFLLLLTCCCCMPHRSSRSAAHAQAAQRRAAMTAAQEEQNVEAALRQAQANSARLAAMEAQLLAAFNGQQAGQQVPLSPRPYGGTLGAPAYSYMPPNNTTFGATPSQFVQSPHGSPAPPAPAGVPVPSQNVDFSDSRTEQSDSSQQIGNNSTAQASSLPTDGSANHPRIIINNITSEDQKQLRTALDDETRRTRELEDRVRWLQEALAKRERADLAGENTPVTG